MVSSLSRPTLWERQLEAVDLATIPLMDTVIVDTLLILLLHLFVTADGRDAEATNNSALTCSLPSFSFSGRSGLSSPSPGTCAMMRREVLPRLEEDWGRRWRWAGIPPVRIPPRLLALLLEERR
eukprot:GHVU01155664.1.p3 GENE.GHVU01155664.1~~GHVU01155664.1.p3  ORF type:complete len:124 (-),score=18.79 GHVU01155664.1:159-530(-)